ncbi:hypothetical protein [Deinococcus marmoris]|uniref:hypothetical protein n=1 Tax=Deinococcus marmoris TaxID=249408 RepID=UPI0012DFDC5D|nr:hypothetical protein [Deinococcus marmoris]
MLVPKGILECQIEKSNNPANSIKIVEISDTSILFEFDYLDKSNGLIINCIHKSKSGNGIEIEGIIKGFGKPKRIRETRIFPIIFFRSLARPKFRKFMPNFMGTILFVTGILASFLPYFSEQSRNVNTSNFNDVIFFRIVGTVYIVLGVVFFYGMRRRIPKDLTLELD